MMTSLVCVALSFAIESDGAHYRIINARRRHPLAVASAAAVAAVAVATAVAAAGSPPSRAFALSLSRSPTGRGV